MELPELLKRCRDEDELAWEALVRRYQGRVYGMACHYVGRPEDARDLAQEVFIRIYQNLKRLPEPDGFLPWCIRITRNACIDHIRRLKVRPPAQDFAADEIVGLSAIGRNPEEECAENARKRLVYSALRELTDLNREIILLKEIQGMSLEEIASMLKIPVGTAKSRSNRARIELAQKLSVLRAEFAGNPAN